MIACLNNCDDEAHFDVEAPNGTYKAVLSDDEVEVTDGRLRVPIFANDGEVYIRI